MFLKRYRDNFAFLRKAAEIVGSEYERMPYKDLQQPAEVLSSRRMIEGIEISFSAGAYNQKKNGDLAVCIDVNAKLPTIFGIKPSYHFYKRPDGTVYY